MTLQADSPHICCDTDTGDFCRLQCNNGICQCVDPATGVPVSDITFPENDESISCDLSELAIEGVAKRPKHSCWFKTTSNKTGVTMGVGPSPNPLDKTLHYACAEELIQS